MRISKFCVSGLASYDIIATRLNVICNMLIVSALVGAIFIESNSVPTSSSIVPDINRFQVYVIVRLSNKLAGV
jgi:hypothetical protein